jgi:hypothetical protein
VVFPAKASGWLMNTVSYFFGVMDCDQSERTGDWQLAWSAVKHTGLITEAEHRL